MSFHEVTVEERYSAIHDELSEDFNVEIRVDQVKSLPNVDESVACSYQEEQTQDYSRTDTISKDEVHRESDLKRTDHTWKVEEEVDVSEDTSSPGLQAIKAMSAISKLGAYSVSTLGDNTEYRVEGTDDESWMPETSLEKDSNLSMESISDNRSSKYNLAMTWKNRELHEAERIAKLEDRSIFAKDLKLEFYEAEQELAKIIHKQMEELIKDDQVDKEEVRGEEEEELSFHTCPEVSVSESCEEPSKESESQAARCPDDIEKICVLDRVSDELRNMISSLEYNLSAGISKNIKITPILARLEQLEQEVVNITKSSETTESSIPLLFDANKTYGIVSCPQRELLPLKGAETSCGGKETLDGTSDITGMPDILGKETGSHHLPGEQSPTGETNVVDALTDVEVLLSDVDQSPLVMRKSSLLVPRKDKGSVTDTEDMDLSGDEDELIQEKANLPFVQDLGLLPELTKEIIHLTEGYARDSSPLLSGSESEVDVADVQERHKDSMKRMETLTGQQTPDGGELQILEEDDWNRLTDIEDIVVSGEEVEEAAEATEHSLPDHYMDQGEGISYEEKLGALTPAPKGFLPRHDDDSSDEEQFHKQKQPRRRSRGLKVEIKEGGTTDVEDLVLSDNGEDTEKTVTPVWDKVEARDKPKKKEVCHKVVQKPVIKKTIIAPSGDADPLTDVETLTGDDEEDALDDDEPHLKVPEQGDRFITDSEDVEASDIENVEALLPKPIQKLELVTFPPLHAEKVKITETEEKAREESGVDTDEEGIELDDKEDERPLITKKRVSCEPLETAEKEALDVEEPCESVLTDTETFDLEDREEAEIMMDVASRIPEEGEIYTLKEMGQMGRISKTEMIMDVHAELKQQKDAEHAGITLQEALIEDTLIDVEDLDEEEKSHETKRKVQKDDGTDEESVNESDIEEEIPRPHRQGKRKGRRLPLAPHISEVQFIETKQGPVSIIVTPDTVAHNKGHIPKEQVANVVFFESEEKDNHTDVEELGHSEDEAERKPTLKTPQSTQDPVTDTEDLDFDPTELDRPLSPLPLNVEQCVFSSPKRELIHIKEDKYGVPQVTIRKLGEDEVLVSDTEDGGATDTEDIELSEGELLRIVGVTEDDTSNFELEGGHTEVSSRMIQKECLEIEPEEDGANTDVEELSMTKKNRYKPRSYSKLTPKIQEDSHTDIELLSDQDDKSNLKIYMESPGVHTDVEYFETSEAEELELPEKERAPTPDIVTNSAIRKVIIMKEGPDGTIHIEESEIAPARKNLFQVEDETEGVTDVEDIEASGTEDEDLVPDYPPVELPDYEPSDVSISEKSRLPKCNNEAKHVKDNLLLPEDNYNNQTDVESLSEGEGNRCASSNTDLLSRQQLTYAVESCTVAELSYYLPSTDPNLCVHPGVSLESDPFCGELTSPLVVEAELEQVYYHAPKEDAHGSEVELEASDGCVVRKRQVVASLCQAREIRRFWSLDRNSPLNQSEINAFATPTIHKKGFKTILYLEQPNLLDTISISDTLCDSNYLKNERLLDFDSSSIDSFDDHFSYRDSDIVTVVDQFNQGRGSSFDDLPSPHLSSISSSAGVVDSFCSGRSLSSDQQCYEPPQSPFLYSSFSKCSSDDLKKESELTLSLSGISAQSCSPDNSLYQEVELTVLGIRENNKCRGEAQDEYDGDISVAKQTESILSSRPTNMDRQDRDNSSINKENTEEDERQKFGSTEECSPVLSHCVSKIVKGLAIEYHEGFTTECIQGYASKLGNASAIECTEGSSLEKTGDFTTDCVKGFATECIENPQTESVEEFLPDYVKVDSTTCIRNPSPTGYIQKSITEWVVGRNISGVGDRNQDLNVHSKPFKSCSQLSNTMHTNKPVLKCLSKLTSKSASQPTFQQLKPTSMECPVNRNSQHALKLLSSDAECTKNTKVTYSESNINSFSSILLQSGKHSDKRLGDSGVYDYQASGSFTSSFEKKDSSNQEDNESDRISLADSVLGLGDQLDKNLLQNVEDSSITYISARYSPTSQVSLSQIQDEIYSKKPLKDRSKYPEPVVPTYRHTLPRASSKLNTKERPSVPKVSGNIARDFKEISKDFGGVKGLIDQWEVKVRKEHLRSLPTSPAVGRKMLAPYNGNKRVNVGHSEGKIKNSSERGHAKRPAQSNTEVFDARGNIIKEVASVCDIIQKFEGRVGRLGKMNAHRQRLPRRSQSPASRSPSHHRRVATVKPLCEPPLQQEGSLPLQGGQMQQQPQQHQAQLLEFLEHTVSAGFVPRVVESLSVTKCSNKIWEENPPQASVSNPEGTHEAAQITEQQPAIKSHDQDQGCSDIKGLTEPSAAGKAEPDMVEADSPKDGSPSDNNVREQSLSDLLDSDDVNRDSLEEEFDRLAAQLSLSPSADDIVGVSSQRVTKMSTPDVLLFPVSSSIVYPSKSPDALQATQREPGLDVEELSNVMESYTSDGSDLITTTTHTITSVDPDPITSTQTTRITRRTEIKDGEVKEDVYEEY